MPTEHEEQVGFVNWFRSRFPDVLIFAIPNGGFRSIATARHLVREGVVAGMPDLCIPAWRLWIEMKRIGGRPTRSQRDVAAYLEQLGETVIVGNGATDASVKVLSFLQSLK